MPPFINFKIKILYALLLGILAALMVFSLQFFGLDIFGSYNFLAHIFIMIFIWLFFKSNSDKPRKMLLKMADGIQWQGFIVIIYALSLYSLVFLFFPKAVDLHLVEVKAYIIQSSNDIYKPELKSQLIKDIQKTKLQDLILDDAIKKVISGLFYIFLFAVLTKPKNESN